MSQIAIVLALLLAAQSTTSVSWDLDPTHGQAGVTFEAEVDGQIVPCQNVTVSATQRSCTLAVHPGANVIKLRARNSAGISIYSNVISTSLPGLATVLSTTEVEPPVIVPGQTVLAYGFNEGTGTRVAGIGPTGTVNGATWAVGKYGQALSFAGSQSVTVGNVAVPGAFTVMAWMQMRTLQAACCNSLIMKENDYGFELYNGRLWALVGDGNDWTAGPSHPLTSADLNVWKHVALTYDGTTARLYVGGALVSSETGAHASSTKPLVVGSLDTGMEFWDGLIDEVRIYDRVLSQAEVQADMAAPVP